MDSFAHLLDGTVHSLQPILILLILGSWALAMVGQISAHRSRKPGSPRPISGKFILGMAVFASIIGGEFAIGVFLKSAALKEVNPKLGAQVGAITVNEKPFDRPDDLLTALRSMRDAPAHHSHPTIEYRVLLITSLGPLELRLCRDSDNPNEYWVFYSGFQSTRRNEIGRVFTGVLDGT